MHHPHWPVSQPVQGLGIEALTPGPETGNRVGAIPVRQCPRRCRAGFIQGHYMGAEQIAPSTGPPPRCFPKTPDVSGLDKVWRPRHILGGPGFLKAPAASPVAWNIVAQVRRSDLHPTHVRSRCAAELDVERVLGASVGEKVKPGLKVRSVRVMVLYGTNI